MNDTYGHQAGDKILKAVSHIVSGKVRKTDVVGRYGGEEFLVILPGADSRGAQMVFQRMVEAVAGVSHDIQREQPLQVTISIGFATRTKEREFADTTAIVQAADQALYSAKASGRNMCVKFEHHAPVC